MLDDEAVGLARAEQDQYFLTSPAKLALLVRASGIRPADHVVEVGAGVGTVARELPACARLTLIELDSRLIEYIRINVPHARVIQGDGLVALEEMEGLRCDVLIGNLPTRLSEKLLERLSRISFRTAVITMDANTRIRGLSQHFAYEVVTSIGGNDFQPPQPTDSILVKITRTRQWE